MSWIINIIGKWTGVTAVWAKVDGYKTKISGVALFLSGLSILLTQIIGLPHDISSVLAYIQVIPNNSAWLTMLSGLGVLGIGHKIEKVK